MKTSLDELDEYLSRLILGGATGVSVEFMGGLTILGWRFPGQPGDCMPLELESLAVPAQRFVAETDEWMLSL